MPSLRERILAVLQLRLATALPAVDVQRAPLSPARRESLPLLVVEPQSETVEPRSGEQVERHLQLSLTVLTRGDAAALQADQIQVAVHQALMVNATPPDPAFLIRELDCDWDAEEADLVALRLTTRYLIIYHSHPQDMSREE